MSDRQTETAATLFGNLPDDPAPLRQEEAVLLAGLPVYPTTQAVEQEGEAICLRLEKRGLVKVHREKDDPIAMRPTFYAGRLP